MIRFLSVQNFSVIEDIEIEFSDGLNIFTGETGAGKTVIINAVKILVGEKLSKTFFRDETKPIKIQGIFSIKREVIGEDLLSEFEIDDEVIIRREFDLQGKNRILVNGNVATQKQLQTLTQNFLDIHGQHEHQLLLNPKNHLSFVDMLIDHKFKMDYLEKYRRYKQIENDIKRLTENIQEMEREREYLKFHIEEIESLKVDPEKDKELESRISVLTNIDKIKNALTRSLNCLSGDEINIENLFTVVSKEISSIVKYSDELKAIGDKVDSIFYEIQDIAGTIEGMIEKYELDESEMNTLIDRKDKIDRVCKKYNKKMEELPDYLSEIKRRLEDIDLRDERIEKLTKELSLLKEELETLRGNLNNERRKLSNLLEEKITKILKELELKNAVFEIKIEDLKQFDEKGGVDLEFFISTNIGFEPGPLSKIASGGEISRVMLALKEAFAEVDIVDTLIFDEIDTGISGITAKKVAEKLKKISESKQVIVITHLPVVAAMGDKHFHLTKIDEGSKTKTTIRSLDEEERKYVLASMIAGEITENSLKQAEELLKR
ncbi:DNA repair protein RecN [Calditerrivibrio sp.]|jgi:DNA repair protein RecN (Recombination protein N)|uniref:DNA repair protein RecN n=1 Tax=Calditerrivibrio sp. TaxID=2792612 RepID=UPI003D152A16